ncbi:MAG TPA: hypothetical protein VFO97_03650, partial [Desertimonas sp.]|nr:hypothetical protein [Desertimonas sp.]
GTDARTDPELIRIEDRVVLADCCMRNEMSLRVAIIAGRSDVSCCLSGLPGKVALRPVRRRATCRLSAAGRPPVLYTVERVGVPDEMGVHGELGRDRRWRSSHAPDDAQR